jgi:hypothetical protein
MQPERQTTMTITQMKQALTLEQWQAVVRESYPNGIVQFTVEDGTGRTYGEVGEWTAHIGPDMQEDVVGVYCPGEFCNVYPPEAKGEPIEYSVPMPQPKSLGALDGRRID